MTWNFKYMAQARRLYIAPDAMTARNVNTLHRLLPLWLAPCVCLPLLLLYPSKAEPTPRSAVVSAAAVSAPMPPIAAPEIAEPAPEPDTVHVVLVRGRKRLELDLPRDGKVSPETAKEIAKLMRCRESGRTRRIAPGTLALLADIAARFPGHEIEIVSAVRAEPERNLTGVKHSKHWTGHAIDLKVRGVKLTEVRDAIWKNHRNVGVGYYPASGFVHIDYRPDIGDTSWTQPRRNANYQYNPRWARLARAEKPAHETANAPAAWGENMKVLRDAGAVLSSLVPSLAELLGLGETSVVRALRDS